MCGIFGLKGKGSIREKVETGLKDLEYRGYDSSGFCLNGKDFFIFKKIVGKGKISQLVNDIPFFSEEEIIIISHTRWATHGKISEINSHPHFDCKNEIAVVHNGIIENYIFVKNFLVEKGHNFISETDTEIIPHLIEEKLKENEDILSAIFSSLKLLEGSFAFLLTKKGEDFVIGARKGSPLVIGIDKENFYFSSDVIPIIKYTNRIVFLEDGEMFFLDKKLKFYNFKEEFEIEKKPKKIDLKYEIISRGNFETYMLKEIYEQPDAIRRTIEYFLKETFENLIKRDIGKRIIITGCGTSWHAGLVGKYMIEEFLRIPVEVEYASELRYRNPVIGEKTNLIAISQSGETADTLGVVRELKGKCEIFSICNVLSSSIARESDFLLLTKAGPEIGVASTKAFTSQIAILYLFCLSFLYKMNRISNEEFYNKVDQLLKITVKIEKILSDVNIKKIVEKLIDKKNALYLGRGINFPISLEGALKLKEVSYIHAEGYPAAEMKHGPIALIDENMPVIFIAVKDKLIKKIISNIQEVKTRKGYIITITDFFSDEIENISDEIIKIPFIENEYLKPILTVIPLQLIAYFVAKEKNLDVDKPRNLAKSVTVE